MPLVARSAGEEKVGPLVREPIVAGVLEFFVGGLLKAALRAEMLDVALGLALAEAALVVLGKAKHRDDAGVGVDGSADIQRLRGEVGGRGVVGVFQALGGAGAGFDQVRRWRGRFVDADHVPLSPIFLEQLLRLLGQLHHAAGVVVGLTGRQGGDLGVELVELLLLGG